MINDKVVYFDSEWITHKFFGEDITSSELIENSSSIEYIGSNSITLNPGFEVEIGAIFYANVGPNH